MSEYKAKAKAFKAGLEAKASLEDYNTAKELNHAVNWDLENGRRSVKRCLDQQTYPYHLFR